MRPSRYEKVAASFRCRHSSAENPARSGKGAVPALDPGKDIMETAASQDIIKWFKGSLNGEMEIKVNEPGKRTEKIKASILDISARAARCEKSDCVIKFHKVVLLGTTPTHRCSGGGRGALKTVRGRSVSRNSKER